MYLNDFVSHQFEVLPSCSVDLKLKYARGLFFACSFFSFSFGFSKVPPNKLLGHFVLHYQVFKNVDKDGEIDNDLEYGFKI